MTRRHHLAHRHVEFIPKELEEGILYVSTRYRTASHLCCCGCGEKVVTPLNPAKWSLTDHGDSVSLSPSIGLGAFACRSHYWVRRGQVDWSVPMTSKQTRRAQQRDEFASQLYTGERKMTASRPYDQSDSEQRPASWWVKILAWLGVRPR